MAIPATSNSSMSGIVRAIGSKFKRRIAIDASFDTGTGEYIFRKRQRCGHTTRNHQ
jgi:hypothetical protein